MKILDNFQEQTFKFGNSQSFRVAKITTFGYFKQISCLMEITHTLQIVQNWFLKKICLDLGHCTNCFDLPASMLHKFINKLGMFETLLHIIVEIHNWSVRNPFLVSLTGAKKLHKSVLWGF